MKILVSGASGRIGREIRRLVEGEDLAEIVGRASREQFFSKDSAGEVLIDFSRPELTARCLDFAVPLGLPMVIGTTGIDTELKLRIEGASDSIPICQAANFSLGVNLLLDLVRSAAAGLPATFDAEISEIHHRWKIDAPSGTALELGAAVAEARGLDHDKVTRHHANGRRESGEIGYQAIRGGDVAGEHTVLFLGDGERLELSHKAGGRAVFARGALHAARWLVNQPPGLYSMRNVLKTY